MFDVKKYLIKIEGNRQYLPVSARLVWFRQEHPDWGIETKSVRIDMEKQFAIFEATVFNAEGKLMATGTKMETANGFPAFVEAAETGAIGRALAVCGYGTQFAPDLDEISSGRLVDSPQPAPGAQNVRNGNSAPVTDQFRYQPRPAQSHNGGSTEQINGFVSAKERNESSDTEVATEHDIPVASSQASNADQSGEHECAGCGRGLTKGQEALSVRKFGIALCPDCQKERKTADAGI